MCGNPDTWCYNIWSWWLRYWFGGSWRSSLWPHPPSIGSENREDHRTQIPADQGITDFGPLPRRQYPLVAVLTLAEPEARDAYNIVSPPHTQTFCSAASGGGSSREACEKHTHIQHTEVMLCFPWQVASVTVLHLPDDRYNLSARVVFQYLLTSQGNMYELKVRHILVQAACSCLSSTVTDLTWDKFKAIFHRSNIIHSICEDLQFTEQSWSFSRKQPCS